MASLKCSNCGEGIRYHDEADGTQYIVFPEKIWNNLMESKMFVSRYILDGTNDYHIAWKCKKCGTIHIFKQENTEVLSVYRPIEIDNANMYQNARYVVFSDLDWDTITEDQIYGTDISEKFPDCVPRLFIRSGNYLSECKNDGTINALYELVNG